MIGDRNGDEPQSSVFDDLTAPEPTVGRHPPPQHRAEPAPSPAPTSQTPPGLAATAAGEQATTPGDIKRAVQELMKLGSLDATAKPKLYATTLAHRQAIATVLEPLDLVLRIDDVRGLAFLAVNPAITSPADTATPAAAATTGVEEGADWNHPLVRRQRMTLAQSLLVALLRRHYLDYERTGDAAGSARVYLEDLVPELQPYLGHQGSDDGERTRVRRLLEQLKEHGIVSPLGEDESVTIKPLICHLADPQSLELLLASYRAAAETSEEAPQ